MKQFLAFCLLISSLISLNAQITINESDMPSPGDLPRTSTADTLIAVDPTPTGANFVWDFSNLKPIFQEVDSFIARSDLPFTLQFAVPSSADMAQYLRTSADSLPFGGVSFSGGYQIYDKSATAYSDLGQATLLNGLLPLFLEKDPVDVIYRFPLNFTDEDSVYSQALLDLNLPGLGAVYIQQDRTRESAVDGWGNLKTPYGSFDCLRIRSEIVGEDSIMFDTLFNFRVPTVPRVEYVWLAKGQSIPVLRINAINLAGSEVVTQVIYRDSLRPEVPTVGLADQLAPLKVEVFPNPVRDQLRIQLPDLQGQMAQIRLFDLQGRLLLETQTRSVSEVLEVGTLPAGTLMLEIKTDDRYYVGRVVKE